MDVSAFGHTLKVSYTDTEGIGAGSAQRSVSLGSMMPIRRPSGEPERFERLDLDGVDAQMWVGPAMLMDGKLRFTRHVRIVLDGTRIELRGSGIGREELLGYARALVPARDELPKLDGK